MDFATKHRYNANSLTVKLPNSIVLRIIARSLLLGLVVLSFPWMGSTLRGNVDTSANDLVDLPMLFHDLVNEGLLKSGDKTLYVSNEEFYNAQVLSENEMDLVSNLDYERQGSIPSNSYDFVFASDFDSSKSFIHQVLKVGGIVVVQSRENNGMKFKNPSNYQVIYVRRFGSTFVAMRKSKSPMNRKLLSRAPIDKKIALKGLEDVLLEPPRASSGKSNRYLKRTKYLPDLMGDTLESYPRRVFVDVGLPDGGGMEWFTKNYPTRNKKFDMYKIETVAEEGKEEITTMSVGMSEWVRRNVKEEEYVVMKAEAEVVEEMVNSRVIGLVDELFLECKPQGVGGRSNSRSTRAYWECLALYGKLRDEGVAVHQWWG